MGDRGETQPQSTAGPRPPSGARVDLQPEQTFVVIPGDGGYPLADGVEVLGLAQLAERIHGQR